LKYFPSRRYV
jgi:hypothetical protein